MKFLLRILTLGLYKPAPDPKKRKPGHGNIFFTPLMGCNEKTFRKEVKKLLPYITPQEMDCLVDRLKAGKKAKALVPQDLYDTVVDGRYRNKHIFLQNGSSRGCCSDDFIHGCCSGPVIEGNEDLLKDYFILEYAGVNDFGGIDHG